ncbi:hypothetical protein ACP70R_046738 [Stipagrostis hirtigluma subsp. patula]
MAPPSRLLPPTLRLLHRCSSRFSSLSRRALASPPSKAVVYD